MDNRSQIISSAKNRGINYLVHFTNADNLSNILSFGLCTRAYLDNQSITYNYNDNLRLDEACNSISLSVAFPNYKMFYKLRCDDLSKNWIILFLDADLILNLDCAFCFTNAANTEVSSIPLQIRKTASSFDSMFAERGKHSRAELNLSDYETTDPQAEILAFNNIPFNAIKLVFFDNYKIMNYYSALLNLHKISFKCDKTYYMYRHDYMFW